MSFLGERSNYYPFNSTGLISKRNFKSLMSDFQNCRLLYRDASRLGAGGGRGALIPRVFTGVSVRDIKHGFSADNRSRARS